MREDHHTPSEPSHSPSLLPPGFGEPGFEVWHARAQTWMEFGYAGAPAEVMTRVAYGFDPPVIRIIEWTMDQLDGGALKAANDNEAKAR